MAEIESIHATLLKQEKKDFAEAVVRTTRKRLHGLLTLKETTTKPSKH